MLNEDQIWKNHYFSSYQYLMNRYVETHDWNTIQLHISMSLNKIITAANRLGEYKYFFREKDIIHYCRVMIKIIKNPKEN